MSIYRGLSVGFVFTSAFFFFFLAFYESVNKPKGLTAQLKTRNAPIT